MVAIVSTKEITKLSLPFVFVQVSSNRVFGQFMSETEYKQNIKVYLTEKWNSHKITNKHAFWEWISKESPVLIDFFFNRSSSILEQNRTSVSASLKDWTRWKTELACLKLKALWRENKVTNKRMQQIKTNWLALNVQH